MLAYGAGIAIAYLLTRSFVFGASEKGPVREMSWFVLVNVLGVLQTLTVSIVLAWYGPLCFEQTPSSGPTKRVSRGC